MRRLFLLHKGFLDFKNLDDFKIKKGFRPKDYAAG